jgi:hypothetical protein
MAPTSICNTYKVNYNLQLLRMCIWISPYHTTTALIVERLEFRFLVIFWEQTTVWVSTRPWGCRPIHNSSHINVKHIYGVLQSSCAVDVHVDESLPCYCHSYQPSVWMVTRILGVLRWANQSGCVVLSLRIDPFKMAPASMSSTYKVNYNLYMLWMCIWTSPYHATSILVSQQAFGS